LTAWYQGSPKTPSTILLLLMTDLKKNVTVISTGY